MTAQKLQFRPGVNVQLSQTLNKDGFSGSNLVRFFQQLPQKLGGWQRLIADNVQGSARALHAWADLDGDRYIAIGSEQALQVYTGTDIANITPIRRTSDLIGPLTTTAASSIVTVVDTGSATNVGDSVSFIMQTAVDGLFLYGDYQIVSTSGPDSYQIDAGAPPSKAFAQVAKDFQAADTLHFDKELTPIFGKILPDGAKDDSVTAAQRSALSAAGRGIAQGLRK